MKIACLIYGRNEENTLPTTLPTLMNQGFSDIIYVDDCSHDNSIRIAERFDITIIKRTIQHESYVGKALLSKVVNEGIKAINRLQDIDYFMITGCDIRLPEYYTETIVLTMENDKRLMVCSGSIKGEQTTFTFPRGAGRVYRYSFWDRYIKLFPLSYIWESYPVYKALSLGYETRSISYLHMVTSRPTTAFKSGYGYAMREIGYTKIYALARCFYALMMNRKSGMRMFKTYIFSDLPVYDELVSEWVKNYQIRTLMKSIRKKARRL